MPPTPAPAEQPRVYITAVMITSNMTSSVLILGPMSRTTGTLGEMVNGTVKYYMLQICKTKYYVKIMW